MGEKFSQVNHKQIGVCGGRGDLPEPEHPCGLNAHEAPEGDAGVEVGAAGLVKARRNLGEAGDDDAHAGAGGEHGIRAEVADERGHSRGKAEDSTADDGVHDERDQAPASDGADQLARGLGCGGGFHPCVCIIRGAETGSSVRGAALRAGLNPSA